MRIGFVLLSPAKEPIPSTRISVLNMLPYLREAGFRPTIVFEPQVATERPDLGELPARVARTGLDIVYFQKVRGPSAVAAADALRGMGVKTVYGVCDLVEPEMVQATDATVAVTEFLRSLYPERLREKVFVVPDGVERPEVVKTSWREDRGERRRPLEAVLVTSHALYDLPSLRRVPEFAHLTVVGRYAAEGDWRLRAKEAYWAIRAEPELRRKARIVRGLGRRRVRRIPWDPEGVYDALLSADVAVIPVEGGQAPAAGQPEPSWRVKSENRLTLKMSIGLPVIAGRVPSYEPVLRHGENGFFAETPDEWAAALEKLRDPTLRREMGGLARASVLARFSKEAQAERLIGVLNQL